jgi:uncharacterized membrane-anchored protein YitT (DUF2179 family)
MIKPKGVTRKWSTILTLLFYFNLLSVLIGNFLFRDTFFWYFLMGLSLLAAVVLGVLLWFYYNLPHKLKMLEDNAVQ